MKTLTTLVLTFLLTLSAGCSVTGQARAADDGYFSQAELDSMLAPVALYPDSVLSHVLIAATYPLEVIQAARWSREHPGYRGEDAVDAVEYENWDPSVKALVAFPELLERMDEDLQWTQNLGDAFLAQEEDVIASIQYLRSEAYSQGHLRSNDRVKIVREREYIYIEPARTRVVYVPYYDPRVIYSHWRWSSYRPHYWHRPHGFSVSVNFHWGQPYYLRPDFYFSSFHWPTRRVVVVNHHHYYSERRFHSGRQVAHFEHARHWKHDPVHRRGVSYRGRIEQTRFVSNDRPDSARLAATRERTVARAERREWSENKRRSTLDLDRSRSRTSTRSDRVAELRDRNRDTDRSSIASRGSDPRVTTSRGRDGSAERATSRSSREATQRSISGRAPARAESGSRERSNSASTSRSNRVSESLRSSNRSSRSEISSRSSSAERSAAVQRSLEANRSTTTRRSSEGSRSSSQRNSISIPRSLSSRSDSSSRASSSSRSRAATSGRDYSTRSSTPSRSTYSVPQSSGRSSATTRSAPSRSTSTRSSPSAPSRASTAPQRRSESRSSRSSRSSASSRSRDGGSRRDGEERR